MVITSVHLPLINISLQANQMHISLRKNIDNFSKWEIYYSINIQSFITDQKVSDHFMFFKMIKTLINSLVAILLKKV